MFRQSEFKQGVEVKNGRLITSVFAVVLALTLASVAVAAEDLSHSYLAYVDRIIDGDSLYVYIPVWPGIVVKAYIRISGIDTPETQGAECPEEKELALKVEARLRELLPKEEPILLHIVKARDKYGRVVADVHAHDGTNMAKRLIDEGLAHVYDGKGRRQGWCSRERKIEGERKELTQKKGEQYAKP